MKGIHTLKIKNFKAFPVEQTFNFEGKHVLIYGENGSGKSSIYWALYTLLQSSIIIKPELPIVRKKTAKYFVVGGEESLLNVNTNTDDGAITMQLVDQVEINTNYILDKRGFQTTETGTNRLGEMNINSDFISYRLMMNIFNIKHSEKVDLWNMFEKEILPFMETNQENWNDLYNDIIKTRPYAVRNGLLKNTQPNNQIFKDYQTKIDAFNVLLKDKIEELIIKDADTGKNKITQIYDEFFGASEGTSYSFDIVMLPLKFEKRKYKEERGGIEYDYEANNFWDIVPPQLRLIVTENGSNVQKPQSFFNEARLTRIALAIRLAILETRPKTFAHKILVLDDLLISLDMSNRETVLDMLLERYQAGYQLIILTHEKSFFELTRRTLDHEHNIKNWKLYEMYENDDKLKNPTVFDYSNYILKAQDYLNKHDYPACGLFLRGYFEEKLHSLLRPSFRSNEFKPIEDGSKNTETRLKNLNAMINAFYEQMKIEGIDLEPFRKLKKYKDVILNPLIHNDTRSPIYKSELKELIAIAERLEKLSYTDYQVVLKDIKELKCELVKRNGESFHIWVDVKCVPSKLKDAQEGTEGLSKIWQVRLLKVFDNNNPIDKDEVSESFEHLFKDLCTANDIELVDFRTSFCKRRHPAEFLNTKITF